MLRSCCELIYDYMSSANGVKKEIPQQCITYLPAASLGHTLQMHGYSIPGE